MTLKEQMLKGSVQAKANMLPRDLTVQAPKMDAHEPEMEVVPLKDQMERNTDVVDPREGLRLAETFVKKFYLDDLDHYEVTKASRSVLELSTDRNLVMYKISGLIFNKDENVQDRLNNVYSSMHGLNLSVVFMLRSDGKEISFYIGTKTVNDNDDFQVNSELANAFEQTFRGNFPGSEISSVNISDFNDLLKNILPEDGKNAVTSLTSLPSLKDDDATNEQYVQGLEKFIDAMEGKVYTVLVISDPVSGGQIEQMKRGYEELYSEIAPLGEYNLTLTENEGINISQSEMEGYTDTIGRSVSKTQSFTKGKTITKSESTTNTFGIGIGMMGNVGSMSSNTVNSQKNIVSALWSSVFGGPVAAAAVSGLSQAIGGNLGLNASRARQAGTSDADNESKQVGSQDTEQKSHSTMAQNTLQKGMTTGTSTSSMVKYENKSVKLFLECIDDHLKRLKQCENYGMWSSAVYFISPHKETSIISASAYKGIINGEGTALESSSLNTWFGDEKTKMVNVYLRHFTHPRFHDQDFLVNYKATADVTPSTMLSTKEMSVQCSLPYKSVPGVFVREMAEFGRDVYLKGASNETLRIGSIYHMGEVYHKHQVGFHIENLREHAFVTGSTGSGKSNTVYEIIARLNGIENKGKLKGDKIDRRIPTLIVEPAKGEYKQVFGSEFHVFGTNPDVTELLRINPFKFDDNIHVLEHIDRLIDIFNVCWPMYAAMPAVLKEAVELSYINCGWDLSSSKNKNGYDIYPNFADLLSSLREVIKGSDYSQEVKDNYTGSLITRVKSLTNGLNGQIFSSDEIDNYILFEKSTIIDLSRVGSSETKSMIMGIIVMRLQERRMSQGGINLPLKHVTIIEEAHNLLKRTSTEQSSEGANLLGKSVEMISNAIAEMRTYGEGFIIVDQAPGLLDMSAIRNTNTKIILHLPDLNDRELVGKAAGLNDDQLIEIAKLPSGVAAVYQNRWVEPVLCKIDYYDAMPSEYRLECNSSIGMNQQTVRTKIAEYLISRLTGSEINTDVEKLKKWVMGADIESSVKIDVLNVLVSSKKPKKEKIERLIAELVDKNNTVFEYAKESEDIEEWNQELIDCLDISIGDLSQDTINGILECLIHHRSLEHASDEENFLKWMNYMGRRGL